MQLQIGIFPENFQLAQIQNGQLPAVLNFIMPYILQTVPDRQTITIIRVRTGPGNPNKSLNLKNKNPGLESPGILLKVLESPGILNSEKRVCKNGIC